MRFFQFTQFFVCNKFIYNIFCRDNCANFLAIVPWNANDESEWDEQFAKEPLNC